MSPPGDYFTFNQPNIKYLYVICCFYTLGLADSKKFHHVCKFIFAIIFAIMWTCKFFARNQQKHHLAVESWSFKEAATFGSRSTEEFCATRGILRAPFQDQKFVKADNKIAMETPFLPFLSPQKAMICILTGL